MNNSNHNSAKTCVKTLPRLFKLVNWQRDTGNIDIGGGRYNLVTDYLASLGVVNLVWDPYNRSLEHNARVMRMVNRCKAYSATISNVLNVVKGEKDRYTVMRIAEGYSSGPVYITVYEGNKSGVPSISKRGTWQANRTLETYFDEVRKVFPVFQVKDKMIIARS